MYQPAQDAKDALSQIAADDYLSKGDQVGQHPGDLQVPKHLQATDAVASVAAGGQKDGPEQK